MRRLGRQGFTLIEILLVVVIIGIMLSVIVPRAWRANVDAKYGLLRQACNELGSFAHTWVEDQIQAQEEASTSTLKDYLDTLAYTYQGNEPFFGWVAQQDYSNWNRNGYDAAGGGLPVLGRNPEGGGGFAPPDTPVEAIVPPEKVPRNPFNGASVFSAANFPSDFPITGAIACGGAAEDIFMYYAFIFQGTDSQSTGCAPGEADFYAGQDPTLEGLRNGIFLARTAAAETQI